MGLHSPKFRVGRMFLILDMTLTGRYVALYLIMSYPSVQQLQRAITISAQIEKLQAELAGILGQSHSSPMKVPAAVLAATAKPKRRKSRMSAEGRAAIIAAQKARWAKVHAEQAKKAAPKK